MKDFFKKHYIVFLIIINILIILIFLLLDIINFKRFIPISQEYDWLSFFGTIIGTTLGVIATIEAVKLAIKDESEKREKDLAIQYKPHLILQARDETPDISAIIVVWVRSFEYNGTENYNKMDDDSLILKLKNNGRGEAINIRVTDLKIDCCLGKGNPGKKAIFDDINSNRIIASIYPNEEYQIAINAPKTIILEKKYYETHDKYYFRIILNFEYFDPFKYNKYELNAILEFCINLKEMKIVKEFDDKVELKGRIPLENIIFPKL